jgi:hypothetical protein
MIALGYPQNPSMDTQEGYRVYFENLHKVIPCIKCSIHYKEHLNKMPISDDILKDNRSLFKWTVAIHNSVNFSLGKPIMDFETAIDLYTKHYVENNDKVESVIKNMNKVSSKQITPHSNKTNRCNYKMYAFAIIFVFIIIVAILALLSKQKTKSPKNMFKIK